MPAAPANRQMKLLGAMSDQRPGRLAEQALEPAQHRAVGGRPRVHPLEGPVAVPVAQQEEQRIADQQAHGADAVVADRVELVGDEDQVAVDAAAGR